MKKVQTLFLFQILFITAAFPNESFEKLQLVREPYLQFATPTSIIIRWRTNIPSQSVVRYGRQEIQFDSVVTNTTATTEHIVKLVNLKPSTLYYYSVGDNSMILQGNCENHFTTLPLPGSQEFIRIAFLGDVGNNSINQRKVRSQLLKYIGKGKLNAWALLGDNAYYQGTDVQYQRKFFNIYKDAFLKNTPLFPAPGNHDYGYATKIKTVKEQIDQIPYYQIFSMPQNGEAGGVPSYSPSYYSYDIGNAHLISLDSYGRDDSGNFIYDTLGLQVQWLKKNLEANQHKDWIIVYWHHPPYSKGSHDSDIERDMYLIRQNLLPIIERYGVDVVLNGHSHVYERSKLMQGYYGKEENFSVEEHYVSQSTGKYNGEANSCPYIKDSTDNGTIYIVSGSAGQIDRKTEPGYPHNAMFYSNNFIGGAVIMEIEDNRLDVKWIAADGRIRDRFTMMKNVNTKNTINIKKGEAVNLTASFIGNYKWQQINSTSRSIEIVPASERNYYQVQDLQGCIVEKFEVIVHNK